MVVSNVGTANAGGFPVRLVVDGDDEAKEKLVADLVAGEEREVRFDDVRLKTGARSLSVTVGRKEGVAESNEGNNTRKVTARCKDDG